MSEPSIKMEDLTKPNDLLGLPTTQTISLIHDGKPRFKALMDPYLNHIASGDLTNQRT